MKLNVKTPYTFTTFGFVVYYVVLVAMLALILVRGDNTLPLHMGSHISNFSLVVTYLFCIGSVTMLTKFSWKYILANAALLILINLLVETVVSILNTPDIIDALYGIAGVVFALALLVAMRAYGFRPAK